MNRAERRRDMRLNDRQRVVLTGGPLVEAGSRFGRTPVLVPGEHVWIVAAAYRIDPDKFAASESMFLDMENLLTIDGPGCYVCEQAWHAGISPVCPGDQR